jgi:hypothetical protein
MNMAEQILVVVLAAALALFLILAIVATIMVIRLIKSLQAIALKAEQLVGSAEAVGEMVRNTVGKLSLLKFMKHMVDLVHDKTSK